MDELHYIVRLVCEAVVAVCAAIAAIEARRGRKSSERDEAATLQVPKQTVIEIIKHVGPGPNGMNGGDSAKL